MRRALLTLICDRHCQSRHLIPDPELVLLVGRGANADAKLICGLVVERAIQDERAALLRVVDLVEGPQQTDPRLDGGDGAGECLLHGVLGHGRLPLIQKHGAHPRPVSFRTGSKRPSQRHVEALAQSPVGGRTGASY